VIPAERYLRLPDAYAEFLGGLRWSAQDNTLVYRDGSTFAFYEEIALFLEGFASEGRLIHFPLLLHVLQLFTQKKDEFIQRSGRLRQLFAAAHRPVRNAGILGAQLCREIPEFRWSVQIKDVLEQLRDPARQFRWLGVHEENLAYPAEVPPMSPVAFLEAVLKRLDNYSTEELWYWLCNGRGPIKDAGKKLARALPTPRTLSGALAALLNRPRLAGARAFLDQLQGALTLPPRRKVRQAVLMGGYADVTTSGQPEQLLPSQFALDELDFLRRYADHELLYFQREEPNTLTRHELVVLLDQGVRTWGDVRLVLAAAVLALGRQAARHKLPFFVATTSNEGQTLDPVAADDEMLGELVDASDLSPHPGLALERVLEQAATSPRDVVLLTHPRNLLEDDVRIAALLAIGETRLLALTLDAHGQAALSELRHGIALPIRQFRVDFTAASQTVSLSPSTNPGGWRGAVEPIGFPFRFGSHHRPGHDHLFAFDHDGTFLVTADLDGLLRVWRAEGPNSLELLPRPLLNGQLLGKIEAVVGVIGGLVMIARGPEGLAAAYYNFDNRMCSVYPLGHGAHGQDWCYSAEHHAILSYVPSGSLTHALELGTGNTFLSGKVDSWGWVEQAWCAVYQGRVPARRLLCITTDPIMNPPIPMNPPAQICYLDPDQGRLELKGVQPPWERFTPLEDGQPVLAGATLVAAKCRGNVLAVLFREKQPTGPFRLRLFHRPNGILLADYPVVQSNCGFVLSSDGRLFAEQVSLGTVQVRTVDGRDPLIKTFAGGSSPPGPVRLGDAWIMFRAGRHSLHLISWESGRLELHQTRSNKTLDAGMRESGTNATAAGVPPFLHYDRTRFVVGATTTVIAVVDRFGQVLILDFEGKLVCMFFVFRDRVSGWLPDGSCFGPDSQSKQPPTPQDLEKFGRALSLASQLGRKFACK
jgi:hypothetical protein